MPFRLLRSVKDFPGYDRHEKIMFFFDESVHLTGIVAIHNSKLGPSAGGTRMYPYKTTESALEDVLNLSRAMTYKCAIAGVPHGGAKAVIIGDPGILKTKDFLRAYARQIKVLDKYFYTGKDVGTTEEDVQLMLEVTTNLIGKKGLAGDPSPYAALTCFNSIKRAVNFKLNRNDLTGVKVAIKGVGKVGFSLLNLLVNDGAEIVIADINPRAIQDVRAAFPDVVVVDSKMIHKSKVDVYSPCAMGKEITKKNYKEINAKIICGAANNQLASLEIGDRLFEDDKLYIPDYIANAGGLINVVDELDVEGYSTSRVGKRIEDLDNRVGGMLEDSEKEKKSLHRISNEIVESMLV